MFFDQYGNLMVNVAAQIGGGSVVNVADPNTPANKLAIDASGRITLVPNQTVELVDSAGTNKLAIDASGRLTLVPNQVIEIGDGTTPTQKLAIDASGRLTLVPNQSINIAQFNGANVGLSNPVLTNDQIRALIANGQGFRATTGVLSTGAANAFIGFQAVANALAKTCVIYNAYISLVNVSNDIRVYHAANATTDANLSGSMSSSNQQPGSGTTSTLALSCSPAATTQTTGFVGTQVETFTSPANANIQPLQNGSQIVLKNGVAANASMYAKIATSGNSAALTIEWVEL